MKGWSFEKVNRISEITKRDILDLFKNGIDIPDLWEIVFLKQLYDLKSMPSLDLENVLTSHRSSGDMKIPKSVFSVMRSCSQNSETG